MGTGTNDRASPNWRSLYEAAILEIDSNKLQVRIAEAECAVMNRMEDLNRSGDGSESRALMNALNVLRDLRRMASEGPK